MFDTRAHLDATQLKIQGDIDNVAAIADRDRIEQAIINKKNEAEMARILKDSNDAYSSDKRARGKLRAVIDSHKQVAADETKALAAESALTIAAVEGEQKEYLASFEEDVKDSAEKLSLALAADNEEQLKAHAALGADLEVQKAATAAALKDAQEVFQSRVTSLTNVITADKATFEEKLSETTGIVMDWKKGSDADRAAIRAIRDGQGKQLNAAIVHAIQVGEARAKQVEEAGISNIENAKKALLSTISQSVENMADNVFASVQGNRQKIADNYLGLKAYAVASADLLEDYLEEGHARNLLSIGDLLTTVHAAAAAETPEAAGEGFGSGTIEPLFSGKAVTVDGSVSKMNGLVNEYIQILGEVKTRYPMGLGAYLMSKLEMSMQNEGALEVDDVEGKNGKFVYINSDTVGLSSKLSDFQGLAVTMSAYESELTKLTGAVAAQTAQNAANHEIIPLKSEWQGD